jgi:hypothetical protein
MRTAMRRHRTDHTQKDSIGQLKLYALEHELLKLSARLQTAFVAETHLAEGKWVEEQVNMLKLRMFRAGT